MTKNNRERQAEFKQRMREAGKKQITIWVTTEQEKLIRSMLAEEASYPSETISTGTDGSVQPQSPDEISEDVTPE